MMRCALRLRSFSLRFVVVNVSLASSFVPSSWPPFVSSTGFGPERTTVQHLGAATLSTAATTCEGTANNPLLRSWADEPFQLAPFQSIKPEHFKPAFDEAMKRHLNDLDDIVNNEDEPSFENVFAAYDRSGRDLHRISSVFGNMCSSLNTEEMQVVQSDMSPVLSRHTSSTYTFPGLFRKMQCVHAKRHEMDLNPEQLRLVERIYLDFTRAGAHFDESSKQEYAEINAELATLCTRFQQNVMKDEESYEMVLKLEDLAGCPDSLVEAAREAASVRNKQEDEYVITLSRSLVEPFLTFCDRRDLRERAFQAWTRRGEMDPQRNNIAIAQDILKLRKRQAELHGCQTFAEYQCLDRMASTPAKVMELLENVWSRAKDSATREREALEEHVKETTGADLEGGIQPWDWRYYAEKVRQAKYDFDESLLKPYLSLDRITDAVMAVSNKLFGLNYVPRHDLKAYHPDVKIYEVREDATDRLVSIFVHDNYARQYKNSGAWMSEYRSQTKNLPMGTDPIVSVPIVSNNNNFAKGKATLLSFDDALTLFHEMGHAHHGMLSDATYSRLSSTNVLTDFVELPSQLLENWLEEPEILKEHARHFETGESVPDDLIKRRKDASLFNQGFAMVEYTSCASLDMAMHQLDNYTDFDLVEFEKNELERLGMPRGIVMRHRPAHFQHLFSGSHYAAGYYVYLWADVLAADAYAAFKESGNVFDPGTASKARQYIYSSGNTVAPDELFRRFRGRDPDIQYVLERKGLL